MHHKIIPAGALAVAIVGAALAGSPAASAAPAAPRAPHTTPAAAPKYVYYGSGPVECHFPGKAYNYVLVELKVQSTNRKDPKTDVNRAYQVGYGRALPGQPDNSEVIILVKAHEYDSAKTPVGTWYVEGRPNDKGGWTQPMPSTKSPWLPAHQWAYETVKFTNEHGDTCTARFAFHR